MPNKLQPLSHLKQIFKPGLLKQLLNKMQSCKAALNLETTMWLYKSGGNQHLIEENIQTPDDENQIDKAI